jgi:hypothetical protein
MGLVDSGGHSGNSSGFSPSYSVFKDQGMSDIEY